MSHIFQKSNGGIGNTFEAPPPLPHDSPPGRNLQQSDHDSAGDLIDSSSSQQSLSTRIHQFVSDPHQSGHNADGRLKDSSIPQQLHSPRICQAGRNTHKSGHISTGSLKDSSNVSTAGAQHRQNVPDNLDVCHSRRDSRTSPKSQIDSTSMKGRVHSHFRRGLNVEFSRGRASCPDINNMASLPNVESPRMKKRRHRGRHRLPKSDNLKVSASPPDDLKLNIPSPEVVSGNNTPLPELLTSATDGSNVIRTLPTLIPTPISKIRNAESDLSKSAPCDTWCFKDPSSDAEAWGWDPTLDSASITVGSCTSPGVPSTKDRRRSSSATWFTRALPFFSGNLGGDDISSEERGMPVPHPTIHGPSAYIPVEELPSLGTFNEQTHMLFIDAFLQNSRLDHVTQVMGYHPTYLDIFLRTQNFILRGDGPLPYDYRHFIAIMAAGRHQCSYLINLQKQEFLLQGGDHTWLKGLSRIPQKLRDLYDINKILAHRPWLLNKSHIEKLTKGKDSWSLAEVVHAIVLLAHFHSLSSFVFGCGVNEELDQDGGHHNGSTDSAPPLGSSPRSIPSPTPPLSTAPSSRETEPWLASMSPEQEVGVDMLMQRMKSLSERAEEFSQEEKTKRFEHVENQSVELSPGLEPQTQLKADIGHFVDDPTFLYQDFARRGEVSDIPTFRVQDYSWDDHGYSLVNRLYNDVGNLLDEKFKTAYNLTYHTMGGRKGVDTSRFRRAIWNYIQCMFGIRHDDYDYGEVNQLLERSLKAFIKSACCFPERVTKKDYDRVLREFKHSEKVHVNLMVLEARMQAELLYALRAVMRYMT